MKVGTVAFGAVAFAGDIDVSTPNPSEATATAATFFLIEIVFTIFLSF
jgi:hypothetical protein